MLAPSLNTNIIDNTPPESHDEKMTTNNSFTEVKRIKRTKNVLNPVLEVNPPIVSKKSSHTSGFDLVNSEIENDRNWYTRVAKQTFFNRLLTSVKHKKYQVVHSTTDIISYFPDSAQGYFHKIVDFVDEQNAQRIVMWSWKTGIFDKRGNNIFSYIFAKESLNNTWLDRQNELLRGIIENDSDNKKEFILKLHCGRNICMQFLDLKFFGSTRINGVWKTGYELAVAHIKANVSEGPQVPFNKKAVYRHDTVDTVDENEDEKNEVKPLSEAKKITMADIVSRNISPIKSTKDTL